jgi:hypothetical protein
VNVEDCHSNYPRIGIRCGQNYKPVVSPASRFRCTYHNVWTIHESMRTAAYELTGRVRRNTTTSAPW